MSSSNASDRSTELSGGPSIAARLTAWYAVSSFFLVVAASGLLYIALDRSLDADNDSVLVDRATEMTHLLRNSPAATRDLAVPTRPGRESHHTPVYLRVLDPQGTVYVELPVNTKMPVINFPPPLNADDRLLHGQTVTATEGGRYKVLSVLVSRGSASGEEGPMIVQVALALAPQEKLLAGYRQRLWIAMSVSLVLCVVIGYEIARRGILPISHVTELAKGIRSTTLDARIDPTNMPAELRSLAGEFNLMLDRLQESFARISRFSADIAHELRTPVNNLRGVAEVALTKARSREEYHDALSSSIEECLRLSHIIENLLFLARAEDPKHQIAREQLDIAHELATVREFYEASASEAGVQIDVSVAGDLHVSLNRTLFQRAVGNLLDNSIKHTPAGGNITVNATRDNNALEIEVADTGRGIPPEHLPRVFDRLYRVADDRSKNTGGSGLGLAIVQSIAHTHGGSVKIDSKTGEGTRVRILIPIDGQA